jgi:hypothetical protein
MHFRMPCREHLSTLLGNLTVLFWETWQLITGKQYNYDPGSLTCIGAGSQMGELTVAHASCPGCECDDTPPCRGHHQGKQAQGQPAPGRGDQAGRGQFVGRDALAGQVGTSPDLGKPTVMAASREVST